MARKRYTRIEDLPVPERELTEEEAMEVKGGLGTVDPYRSTGTTSETSPDTGASGTSSEGAAPTLGSASKPTPPILGTASKPRV